MECYKNVCLGDLKKAGKLEMSKPDGAVDSHEREIKCLGLSFTFKANCDALL